MKNTLVICAAVVLLATPALAQTPPAPPAAPIAPSTAPAPAPAGKGSSQTFQQHKAKIIQDIGAHIAELQQRQTCVQAAADRDALKACMPPKRDRFAQ